MTVKNDLIDSKLRELDKVQAIMEENQDQTDHLLAENEILKQRITEMEME